MKQVSNTTEKRQDVNSVINQDIKGKFVAREIYCNVNSLVEYCLSKGFEDSDSPVNLDEIDNYYTYPEWNKTVLGEDLYFEGGNEDAKEEFKKEFERLMEESDELFLKGEISAATQSRNSDLINEAAQEFDELENEPQEVFEWWAISSYLYDKLRTQGEPVVDAGSCHIWGRTTTGQAILLDGVISRICSGMEILDGQPNSWAK